MTKRSSGNEDRGRGASDPQPVVGAAVGEVLAQGSPAGCDFFFYSCLPDVLSRSEIILPTATMNSLLPRERQPL